MSYCDQRLNSNKKTQNLQYKRDINHISLELESISHIQTRTHRFRQQKWPNSK